MVQRPADGAAGRQLGLPERAFALVPPARLPLDGSSSPATHAVAYGAGGSGNQKNWLPEGPERGERVPHRVQPAARHSQTRE